MAVRPLPTADTIAQIKHTYRIYRHTQDLDRKGLFFSPGCLQICRPTPSYAATTRDQIVQYLKDAAQGRVPVETPSAVPICLNVTSTPAKPAKGKAVYTIRPLKASEFDFSTDAITAPIGLNVEVLKQKAMQEKWVGMRVDLWDEGGEKEGGLLVKVQYWWRFEQVPEHERVLDETEGKGWRQCLHDIMYLGPRDGSEGGNGVKILE
ncbi:hypothetical protein EJ02DRAFT_453741 [Clathrospora elynae]|uniref:SnoaL-like domain-containing protein n=1 Tax=Clathrospora elynae TaxID=706981 RepID=A0A6A5ST69_9PLEO|nr:hypothetical protein EJ02DRAFT_453741 [Clathrospora elynae]